MIDRRTALKILSGAVVWAQWPWASRAAALPPATEEALRTSDLIYVATRRKDGSRSTVRPIWFFFDQGKVFFTTSPSSWKAKRIGRGSPLYIWAGSENGPFVIGKAEPVTDAALIDRMGEAYGEKYWIAWLGFFRPSSERVAAGKTSAFLVGLSEGQPPPAGRA